MKQTMDTKIKNVMKITMSKYSLDALWKCQTAGNQMESYKSKNLYILELDWFQPITVISVLPRGLTLVIDVPKTWVQ